MSVAVIVSIRPGPNPQADRHEPVQQALERIDPRRFDCGYLRPDARPVSVSPDDLAKRGPDFLEREIVDRVRHGPLRWAMVMIVAIPVEKSDSGLRPAEMDPWEKLAISRSSP